MTIDHFIYAFQIMMLSQGDASRITGPLRRQSTGQRSSQLGAITSKSTKTGLEMCAHVMKQKQFV